MSIDVFTQHFADVKTRVKAQKSAYQVTQLIVIGPLETLLFEAFVPQRKAGLIPIHYFEFVFAFITKQK
jgi:hypothetical protein